MSTQTEQNSTSLPASQGSHQWVMTVELPGRAAGTWFGTFTPPTGATRHDVFLALRDNIGREHPEMARANILFFSLEPNQL